MCPTYTPARPGDVRVKFGALEPTSDWPSFQRAAAELRMIELAQIPGHDVGAAMHALLSPRTTREPQSAVIDVPSL